MNESSNDINVEEIMKEIRMQLCREEGMTDILCFGDLSDKYEGIPGIPPHTDTIQMEAIKYFSLPEESLRYLEQNYTLPYYWNFGPNSIKTFAKRIVRKLLKCLLPPILELQNQFNLHIVKCFERVQGIGSELHTYIKQIHNETAVLRQNYAQLIAQQEKAEQNRQAAIEILEETVQAQQVMMKGLEKTIRTQRAIMEKLESTVQMLREKIELLDRQSDAFSASVAKTILTYKRENDLPLTKPVLQPIQTADSALEKDAYTALDYFKFQNHFRGSRSLIMERQTIYLPYYEKSTKPVLDIGCGRGEFLHLLKEENIPALGIDLYPEYAVEGELYGLDIRQGDGIAFLKETDMQFGGIFAAQLVEHISFEQLQALCLSAYEKLVSGGYLILETPNPTCLAIYTNSFYIDPTHQRPVHPALLTYLLQETGFREVQILYTQVSRTGEQIPKIDGDGIRNLKEVNLAIERISELLYGSQDYAVIARK